MAVMAQTPRADDHDGSVVATPLGEGTIIGANDKQRRNRAAEDHRDGCGRW